MKKRILGLLIKYSIKTRLPLHLVLLYLPGFVFSTILIQLPCGPIGYLGLLIVELWEIKMLDEFDNKLSSVFIPTIVIHPLLFSFLHVVSWLILKVNPSFIIPFPDEMLNRLRVGYVIVAYILILANRVYNFTR